MRLVMMMSLAEKKSKLFFFTSRPGLHRNLTDLGIFRDRELEMLNQAALQRKTNQKEARQSKEFLKSYQKRQEAEEKELAEFARERMNDM